MSDYLPREPPDPRDARTRYSGHVGTAAMAAGPPILHSGPQRAGWTPSAPKPLTLLRVRGVRRADTRTGSPAYYLPVWFRQEAAPVRGVKGGRGRGQELLPWLRELAASCHPGPSSGSLPLSFRLSELGGRKVPWGVGMRPPHWFLGSLSGAAKPALY